ncbi:GerMN domain-containing protein [Amycolatopsis rhabdoformis]|uniref:GerMN domain-containing protein n=1 Tax=Amycolatopsis rhabdoformis TaxID=1448059 RepID=A0ABZ1IAL8_9PSEU|nr:GerMN domain-containing protein [Amycolatopsis rhabdoformis]WSE31452.1 GerMN domain-containing protein [Amycolatopsis rhabdoformis]
MNRRVVPAVLLAAVVGAVSACGVQPSAAISGLEAPSGPPSTGSSAPGDTSIYLVAGSTVTPVPRSGLDQNDEAVLDALVQGPTAAEKASGYRTEVPSSALPASVTVTATDVTVQLSTDVQSLSSLATAQIVCTLRLRDVPSGSRLILVGGGNVRVGDSCG